MTAQAAPAAAAGPGSRRRWLGLFFIALGVAMIIVDATIVNVAVPQIIKDLGITSIRLLTSRKLTYVGLAGFGIEIVSSERIDERSPRQQ